MDISLARILSLKDINFKIGVISKIDPQFLWDNVKRGIDDAHQELSDFGLEIDYKGLNNDNYAEEMIISIQEMIDKKVEEPLVNLWGVSLIKEGIF